MQFEGRGNQLQTDMLHHAQGKVMTRKQVDTIKQKIIKGGSNEDKKKDSKVSRYHEIQKEKHEKEKQERQKRLERRMQVKEGGPVSSSNLGKRGRRDSEQDYGEETPEEVLDENNTV